MKQFLIRLDDASEYMDVCKWIQVQHLLDEFSIKPVFGVIPQNDDKNLKELYPCNQDFWKLVKTWMDHGWTPAMHGYEHKYVTANGGMNPVNNRSEFAGLPYEEQAEKIRKGYAVLKSHDIMPEIFFAPSHTYDIYTLKALYKETPIRVICDTAVSDIYYKHPFYFIPQQSGRVRNLPFKTVTFCCHPNEMKKRDFERLKIFLARYSDQCVSFRKDLLKKRRLSSYDKMLQKVYFMMRNRGEK